MSRQYSIPLASRPTRRTSARLPRTDYLGRSPVVIVSREGHLLRIADIGLPSPLMAYFMMPSSTASLDPDNVIRTLPNGWGAMLTAILETEPLPQSVSGHSFFRAIASLERQQTSELTLTRHRRVYWALGQAYAAASAMRSHDWETFPSGAIIRAWAIVMQMGCAIRDHEDALSNHLWVLWQMLRGQLEELISARINHEPPILLLYEVLTADQKYASRIRGQPQASQREPQARRGSRQRESRGGKRLR